MEIYVNKKRHLRISPQKLFMNEVYQKIAYYCCSKMQPLDRRGSETKFIKATYGIVCILLMSRRMPAERCFFFLI